MEQQQHFLQLPTNQMLYQAIHHLDSQTNYVNHRLDSKTTPKVEGLYQGTWKMKSIKNIIPRNRILPYLNNEEIVAFNSTFVFKWDGYNILFCCFPLIEILILSQNSALFKSSIN